MTPALPDGIVSFPGNQDVDATVEKLTSILQTNNVRLFAVVDHSGEAAKAGLPMRNTKVIIFGNPVQGTPLAAPTAALDLPLKMLIYEDADGRTCISYNDPTYLIARHGLPPDLLANISGIASIARKIAQ
jgi:uncharacterized protein (DUF302 family)